MPPCSLHCQVFKGQSRIRRGLAPAVIVSHEMPPGKQKVVSLIPQIRDPATSSLEPGCSRAKKPPLSFSPGTTARGVYFRGI